MGVMDCFVEQHARLAGVPLDADGMKVDVLEATIDTLTAEGNTPKLLCKFTLMGQSSSSGMHYTGPF